MTRLRGERGTAWLVLGQWGWLVLGVLALAGVQVGWRRLEARRSLATGGAEWIWAEQERRSPVPLAFLAARDFSLASPPARARLLALADPEMVLYLNGQRVGTDVYAQGAPFNTYEVGPLLLPGGNRIAAELRSDHGSGGFLACLRDEGTGRVLLATDRRWRILKDGFAGVVGGWAPLDGPGTEAAFSWGPPPAGRWDNPEVSAPRPLLDQAAGPATPAEGLLGLTRLPMLQAKAGPAVSSWPSRPPPRDLRSREDLPAGEEAVIGGSGGSGGSGLAKEVPAGLAVWFDWGREVEGYLALELGHEPGLGRTRVMPLPEAAQTALLYTGSAPPVPFGGRPAASVLLMAGQREWLDAQPRRFRYALVVGIGRPLAARLYPLRSPLRPGPAAGPEVKVNRAASRGVFGLAAPPLHTPMEDEFRRKLESFAGGTGRKEL